MSKHLMAKKALKKLIQGDDAKLAAHNLDQTLTELKIFPCQEKVQDSHYIIAKNKI